MKQTYKTSIEYKRAIHVKNLYAQLKKDRIGTPIIESLCSRLCSTLPKHRQRTLVKVITNWKLQDAHKELRLRKYENTEMWRHQKTTIETAGVLIEFNRLWRREITKYENKCVETHKEKLQHLRQKYKKKERTLPDEVEGIIVKDQEIPAEYSSAPKMYGGVTLEDNEQSLLTLPPGYATYEMIKEEQCEAEIEKSMAKLRWESNKSVDQDGDELPQEEKKWHDQQTHTMDFRQFRSTNFPYNSRIVAPKQLDTETETCIQDLKRRLNQCTKRYVASNDVRKQMNLTIEQQRGLKSLGEKKKRKEVVIFETDKTKRFSCDTIDNYRTLGESHIMNDEVVTADAVKRFEKEINGHTEQWIRMLNAGKKTGNYDRIRTSMKSNNNPPAPLSILRKDHKPCEDAYTGPPGRPVCGGDVSYNKRLSHLMSIMLTDVYAGEKTVCASTEELLAEVNMLNERGITNRHIVGSMDVEALYPSLDIDFTVEKVCELLLESDVNIKGVDYKEVGLYLSLVKTDEELRMLGLHEVCPKRRSRRGPRPNITGCGMKEDKEERHRPWIFPDMSRVDTASRRKMLVEAVRVVLKLLLETHTYDFAGEIRRQREGGAIGMETGVVAQIFMV